MTLQIKLKGTDDDKILTSEELRHIIESKSPDETLYQAACRLERTRVIEKKTVEIPQKGLAKANKVKHIIRQLGFRCGDGTIEEIDKAIVKTIQVAVSIAHKNKRKNIIPDDVNGLTVIK